MSRAPVARLARLGGRFTLMSLTFKLMDEAAARAVLAWRYEEPYSFYNPDPAELARDLQNLTAPSNHYYALTDEGGALVAYFCFGPDARVPGGDYTDAALDVGGGLRPDLTGRGLGPLYIRAALDFARREFAPPALRVTVAAWNRRACAACVRAGFRPVRRFRRAADDLEFDILWQPA